MTDKLIIFKHETGIGVLCPTIPELKIHTLEEIAKRDVPEGKKFKIIDRSDLPADRVFRDAWDVNESDLTDGVGDVGQHYVTEKGHPDYVEPEEEE